MDDYNKINIEFLNKLIMELDDLGGKIDNGKYAFVMSPIMSAKLQEDRFFGYQKTIQPSATRKGYTVTYLYGIEIIVCTHIAGVLLIPKEMAEKLIG